MKRLIDEIHYFMSYKDRFISNEQGYEIRSVDPMLVKKGTAFLIFGGYKLPCFQIVKSIFNYRLRFGFWPPIILLGKKSNKIDNTATLGTEVDAYQMILEASGIPSDVVRRFYVEPNDTNGLENAKLLKEIIAKFQLEFKTIMIVTQSYYRRRAVHDLVAQLPNTYFCVANLKLPDFEAGKFYTDRAEGTALDVMLGACFYQSMLNLSRFDKGEAIAPTSEELTFVESMADVLPELIKEHCGWIYPNNLVDLGIASSLDEGKSLIEARKKALFARTGVSPEEHYEEVVEMIGRTNFSY
ncbi:MAG: ElyC/SanA/YdcF family protein [Alphaproteobacteria bacterium]